MDLVNDVTESLQSIARNKALTMEVLHACMIPTLQADPDRLTQVLTNLIGNAIKFTPRGGTIQVKTQPRDDGFLQICVADTGWAFDRMSCPK